MKVIEKLAECYCNKKIGLHETTYHNYYDAEYECRIFYYNGIAIFRVNDTVKTFKRHKVYGKKLQETIDKYKRYFEGKEYEDVTFIR